MSALRFAPGVAAFVAAAVAALLVGCGALPTERSSGNEPLRTADIVHAPKHDAAAAAAAPEAPAVAPPAAIASAIETPSPAAAPAPLAEVPQHVPPPSAAVAADAAPAPAPAAQARWAVQVGVFAVPANADKDRARVESRLAQSDLAPAQRIVRVERIGDRSHVLVGDLPDRAAAQALAARLRHLLRQDVVVLRRRGS